MVQSMRACKNDMFSDATRKSQKETSVDPEGMPRAWKFGDVTVKRSNGVDTPCVVLTTDTYGGSDPNYVVDCVSPGRYMEWYDGQGSANYVLDSRYEGRNFLTFLDTLFGTQKVLALAIKKTLEMPADEQLQNFRDLFHKPRSPLHDHFKAALLAFINNVDR